MQTHTYNKIFYFSDDSQLRHDTVKPVLKDDPIGHINEVPGDRFSNIEM